MFATTSSDIPPLPRVLYAQVVERETGTPRPGTRLNRDEVGYPRVFSSRNDGLAIGGSQFDGGIMFAAITTDGGRIWRQSPTLFTASADADNTITNLTTAGRTDLVYGPNCVDTSPNGGRTWYRTYFEDDVSAVAVDAHGISAEEQTFNAAGTVTATVQYVSTDGGRRWVTSSQYRGL